MVRHSEGSTSAGYTLLETVVTLAVVSLALLLASGLLLESQRRMADAVRRAVSEPGVVFALRQLRADLRAGSGVTGRPDVMEVEGHPAGVVRYRVAGGELLRTVAAAGATGERPVLREVRRFRWQQLPGSPRVEVELGYMQPRESGLRGTAGMRRRVPTYTTRRLAVALRGGPREDW